MNSSKPIQTILVLDCDDFAVEFYTYLIEKHAAHRPLNQIEEAAHLLLSMRPDIEMEGFVNLFYQLYSLRECTVVEIHLRMFGLNQIADLFAEAKHLYINGKHDITEEEYRRIEPFGTDERWQRFDAIGEQILAEGSELYQLDYHVCDYVKARANELL